MKQYAKKNKKELYWICLLNAVIANVFFTRICLAEVYVYPWLRG